MYLRNGRESSVDRKLKSDGVLSASGYLHERPEQRTRATDFNA